MVASGAGARLSEAVHIKLSELAIITTCVQLRIPLHVLAALPCCSACTMASYMPLLLAGAHNLSCMRSPVVRAIIFRLLLLFQVSRLGRGNYGVTMLLRKRETGELVAGKFMERGGMVRV